MIPKECKRLAEVDFPIAEVSRHAGREKSIRHGHPSTLHLWWARRPLASSRAVLLALLWPDPCDPRCPREFKDEARKLLRQVPGCNPGATNEDLRKALLKFIADFANWDLSSNQTYLDVSRALVKTAHGEEPPLVVDPFAGGGSIPLEALRLGCEVFASDLNPVACLILKTMLEDIPRHGCELGEELREAGAQIKRQAETELTKLYPPDLDGVRPIAYIWARTVHCEAPRCGVDIPLFRTGWLSRKQGTRRALKLSLAVPDQKSGSIKIDVFEPSSIAQAIPGTVRRSRAICPACDSVLAQDRVRAQLSAQAGGAHVQFDSRGKRTSGATLLAVVTKDASGARRDYRAPTERDYEAVRKAQETLSLLRSETGLLSPIPDEPMVRVPVTFGVINLWVYGHSRWGDLFSTRQKLVLHHLSALVRMLPTDPPRARALRTLVALTISRFIDDYSAVMRWMDRGTPAATFARPALPMVWDFCETWPFDDASWSLEGSFDWVAKAVENIPVRNIGHVEQVKAQTSPLPDDAAAVWFTDPPYYDNIPYSYLSDYFYVWLKRMLAVEEVAGFNTALTPKGDEAVAYLDADGNAAAAKRRFERDLDLAFAEGRRVLAGSGIGAVVFAHQTTEGWEAFLSGLISAGWVVTASWPIATERKGRPRAHDSAALATSIHLICRSRPEDASVGDWADVLRELPDRVGDWMERLQGERVRGADLVFACIGPALEIFSRYTKVETADGREVGLSEYLEKVWEVVGRSALAQVLGTSDGLARNGAAGVVEEDARLTALFLWTLQSTNGGVPENTGDEGGDEGTADHEEDDEGDDEEVSRAKAKGFTLVHDVVRRFAQPLGIELPRWEGRVIETKKGVVRLLPINERAKQLFGEDGAQAVAARLEGGAVLGPNPLQGMLFPEIEAAPNVRGRTAPSRRGRISPASDQSLAAPREATTLDRVHAAMLLQASGRTNALRALLKAEQERGPDFLRLANALSALYPKGSEEKRLLDAMLVAVPR